MKEIHEILQEAVERKASDIFIVSGFPLSYKINTVIQPA